MRPAFVILASCAVLAVLAAVAFVVPGSVDLSARPHDLLAPMLVSGVPVGSLGRLLGAIAALLTVSTMTAATLLGFGRAPQRFRLTVVGLFAGYAFIFVMLLTSQAAYEAGARSFVLGFPLPTAWLVYGIWLYPGVILGYLLSGFSRWYYTEEDAARFRDILTKGNVSPGAADAHGDARDDGHGDGRADAGGA